MLNTTKDKLKFEILARYYMGESVIAISKSECIPRSTIYHWIKNPPLSKKEENAKTTRFLVDKVKRLEGIIEIMQKANCAFDAPRKEKLLVLESLYGQYSVYMLCEALAVPRGTFYNHIFRNKRDNTWYLKRREELRVLIQQIFDENK